jgi:hypothetical protein
MNEQQFSNRQFYADWCEMKRIAVECVKRGNKYRRTYKWDEQEIDIFAQALVNYWMDCAKQKNPLRPIGPALAFARQADREKLTDKTAMRYQWQTIVGPPAPNADTVPFAEKQESGEP